MTKHVTGGISREFDMALVEFKTPEGAKKALETLNGKSFLESKLQIEYLENQ